MTYKWNTSKPAEHDEGYGKDTWVVYIDHQGLHSDPWIIIRALDNTYSVYRYAAFDPEATLANKVAGPFDTLDAAKAAYILLLEDE